jgi:hypothetical protein
MYVGKADALRDRVRKNHSGRGPVTTSSAPRRNIAAHLGIASAADIKARRYQRPKLLVASWSHCTERSLYKPLSSGFPSQRSRVRGPSSASGAIRRDNEIACKYH